MYIRCVKTTCKAVLWVIGLVSFNAVVTAAEVPENFQVAEGVAIYLGVIPAEIVQGHPREHSEATMHGGVSTRGHRDHVVVALFDNATGKRIEDAQVTGSVMEIGLGNEQKKLEPMRIADSVTYGNYFAMPDKNIYHIKVQIRRPGMKNVVEAQFTHRHFDK